MSEWVIALVGFGVGYGLCLIQVLTFDRRQR